MVESQAEKPALARDRVDNGCPSNGSDNCRLSIYQALITWQGNLLWVAIVIKAVKRESFFVTKKATVIAGFMCTPPT